jgi:hypothetical protein
MAVDTITQESMLAAAFDFRPASYSTERPAQANNDLDATRNC